MLDHGVSLVETDPSLDGPIFCGETNAFVIWLFGIATCTDNAHLVYRFIDVYDVLPSNKQW